MANGGRSMGPAVLAVPVFLLLGCGWLMTVAFEQQLPSGHASMLDPLIINKHLEGTKKDCVEEAASLLLQERWGSFGKDVEQGTEAAANAVKQGVTTAGRAIKDGTVTASKWVGNAASTAWKGTVKGVEGLRNFLCAGGSYSVFIFEAKGLKEAHMSEALPDQMFSTSQLASMLAGKMHILVTLTVPKLTITGNYSASALVGGSMPPVTGDFTAIGHTVNVTVPLTAKLSGCKVTHIQADSDGAKLAVGDLEVSDTDMPGFVNSMLTTILKSEGVMQQVQTEGLPRLVKKANGLLKTLMAKGTMKMGPCEAEADAAATVPETAA